MIKIEKNLPVPKPAQISRKYKEYQEAFNNMDLGDSFVYNYMKIVDSVRGYAWKNKMPCKYRTIKKDEYRIYKL